MDSLLRKKYSYKISASFDATKAKLEGIFNSKWYDLSKNFYGSIDENGTFSFTKKFVFGYTMHYGKTIYFTGNLVRDKEDTIVNIKLSPNITFVIIIYVLPLLLLNIFFGDNSLLGQENSRLNNFGVVLLLEVVIFTIIQISSFFLRRSFERLIIKELDGSKYV